MRNYPLDHDQLHRFSQSLPYGLTPPRKEFLDQLDQLKTNLNFPAITNDVGALLQFILKRSDIHKIFEFGSGYGHSLFWYCELPHLEQVVLTEKRDDLKIYFEKLPWDSKIKAVTEYHQGDAFERFKSDSVIYDFILVDGVKSSYQDFLELALSKVSLQGFIAIDNSYWRGSFLDPKMQNKLSATNIAKLHEFIATLKKFEAVFIPYVDGLTLIQRISV